MAVDDTFTLDVEASNLQGGQYKVMFQKEFGQPCEYAWSKIIENERNRFLKHLDVLDVKVVENMCPFPPHTAIVKDYSPNGLNEFLPEYIPGNERWKIQGIIKKNGEVVGGYILYLLLRNERSMFNNISSGKK